MFKPEKEALLIYQGSRYEHTIKVIEVDQDTGAETPANLTGFTARMQVRAKHDAAATLFEATTANGRLVINGPQGEVSLFIPAIDSAAWTWKRGVYDVEIESPSGYSYRIMEGPVKVRPEVTR